MEEKKLGTDVIEKDIDVLAEVLAKVLKVVDDGKVTVTEGFSLALEIPKVWKAAKSSKELVAQIKDLDPEESKLVLEKLFAAYDKLTKE